MQLYVILKLETQEYEHNWEIKLEVVKQSYFYKYNYYNVLRTKQREVV